MINKLNSYNLIKILTISLIVLINLYNNPYNLDKL